MRIVYHSFMRALFLALMITLLPLRGWVGDVMAMELVAPTLAASPAHAPVHHAAMADCEHTGAHGGHADALPQVQDAGEAHAGGDCASCSACQICHSVALTAVLPLLPTPVLPSATPQSRQPQYASAERAPGFKPPIS